MNASPAPVVSTSSDDGIFSAVPIYNLPLTVPIPSALSLVSNWEIERVILFLRSLSLFLKLCLKEIQFKAQQKLNDEVCVYCSAATVSFL